MPRAKSDLPEATPEGSEKAPDDMVFTVEYSVCAARMTLKSLLGLGVTIPPVDKRWRDSLVLLRAVKETLR